MAEPRNPLLHIKESLGLSWAELANLLGTSSATVRYYATGEGLKLPRELIQTLKELGYPGDPQADYVAFRKVKKRELMEFLKENWDLVFGEKGEAEKGQG